MKIFKSIIAFSILYETFSQIFHSPEFTATNCVGSLKFLTKSGIIKVVRGSINRTFIPVESVSMKRCGCFHLHSGKNGKGSKRKIFPGQKLEKRELGFNRVRSTFRIKKCGISQT